MPFSPRWPWFWWWRLPFALSMAIIGFALPDEPHALPLPFDHGFFLVAAVLMAVVSFTPTSVVWLRLVALAACLLALGGRASVLVIFSSDLTVRQVTTGIAAWVGYAVALAALTVVFDRLRTYGG